MGILHRKRTVHNRPHKQVVADNRNKFGPYDSTFSFVGKEWHVEFRTGYKGMVPATILQFKEGDEEKVVRRVLEEGARFHSLALILCLRRRPFGVCHSPKFPRLILGMNETISKAMLIIYLAQTPPDACIISLGWCVWQIPFNSCFTCQTYDTQHQHQHLRLSL